MTLKIAPDTDRNERNDIIELQQRINDYRNLRLDEDQFRAYRLLRGIYGQRQAGVQMIRTKIPIGRLNIKQLQRLASVSNDYSNGVLHLTTRQDIQMYGVKLEDVPCLWAELSEVGITLREACGNTIRNVTASPEAGVDPAEAFDVSHCAQNYSRYFLRHPLIQDLGRKLKAAFSGSERDTALAFTHDFGFIARTIQKEGTTIPGFKVVVGGGLGARALEAVEVFDFIPEDRIVPFTEAAIRVFERFGERKKRYRARLKFLVRDMGIEQFMTLVMKEAATLPSYSILNYNTAEALRPVSDPGSHLVSDNPAFNDWLITNTFIQKQSGYRAVYIRIPKGNLNSDEAVSIAALVENHAADDIRITQSQSLLIRFVRKDHLPVVYDTLKQLGRHEKADALHDITACPGSDSCALAVTNTTALGKQLLSIVQQFDTRVDASEINIKLSGCMNSCGHHMIAAIGFHGCVIRHDGKTFPALELVVGGGIDASGHGRMGQKAIKIPTRRAPKALRRIFEDFVTNGKTPFRAYVSDKGRRYYYHLLSDLADLSNYTEEDYKDWGAEKAFQPAIGRGECAGQLLDLADVIYNNGSRHLEKAKRLINDEAAKARYHIYIGLVSMAKSALIKSGVDVNTHAGVIEDFDKTFIEKDDKDKALSVLLNYRSNERQTRTIVSELYRSAIVFSEWLKDTTAIPKKSAL